MRTKIQFASLCIVLGAACCLYARTIVVPGEYPSIQQALLQAAAHDTVLLRPGTYHENITLQPHVTLRGQDAQKVIISGNKKGAVVTGANYATISHCTITRGQKGILCKNTNTVIHHTIIKDNKTGIHCLVSLPTIRNNIIHHNGWTGIFCELIGYSPQSEMAHNIIAANGYCGIKLVRKSEVVVEHNVLLDNRKFGVFVDDKSVKSRIRYNAFFGNRRAANYYASTDKSNIFTDPHLSGIPLGFDSSTYHNPVLRNRGKNGADIGLVSATHMSGIDSDGDRIEDARDECVNVKEDIDEYEDMDGCPDYDNDGDGIYDSDDPCPYTSEDFDNDQDGDGCPE